MLVIIIIMMIIIISLTVYALKLGRFHTLQEEDHQIRNLLFPWVYLWFWDVSVCLCQSLRIPSWNIRNFMGCNRLVRIATCFGLDDPGDRNLAGVIFSALLQTVPGAHPAFYAMDTWSFPGVKPVGGGTNHPPLCSAKAKEIVKLYFYSPSVLSWQFVGWPLPLLLILGTSVLYHSELSFS